MDVGYVRVGEALALTIILQMPKQACHQPMGPTKPHSDSTFLRGIVSSICLVGRFGGE